MEKYTKLNYNKDFFVGYSPERINPGDKKHNLTNISKVISASNKKTLNHLEIIYSKIIKAKIIKAETIKIAEAAKVENTQRDINIALINEFSLIFNKLNIDTYKVLNTASSKWNFLNFKPGLVGGHCIGVDPYYLSYIATQNKIDPKLILSGRYINDNMKNVIIKKIINESKYRKINLKKAKLLICGLSFKPNCSDVTNSQIIEMYKNLKGKVKKIDLYDPLINKEALEKDLKKNKINKLRKSYYDIILIAVSHDCFEKKLIEIIKSKKENSLLINLSDKLKIKNAITF